MDMFMIFIPNILKYYKEGYLYGTIQSNTFYILRILANEEFLNTGDSSKTIGCQNMNEDNNKITSSKKYWLNIIIKDNKLKIKELFINGEDILLSNSNKHIIVIQYNFLKFAKSEMLSLSLNSSENHFARDHFQVLWRQVREEQNKTKNLLLTKLINKLFAIIICLLNFICQILNMGMPLLRYSTLFLHLQGSLKSLKWALDNYLKKSYLSIKIANYLVSTAFDVLIGILILYYFMALCEYISPENKLLDGAEIVVENLSNLLEWLMGSPAGLKLNQPFSKTLGLFFLYHIQLWWIFLEKCTPLLHLLFNIFYWFGHLGLSFQLSILSDILALVGFHVYCIYVYAAKLYNLQIYTLISLSRLFFGKKFNPLRKKVDSCEYSPDQLFVGILAFTILLFLLPTTFVYYIVFTTMRLCMVSLGGILTRIKFFLQAFPLLITYLWITRSSKVTSSYKILLENTLVFEKSSWSSLVLSVEPIMSSLGLLIKENIAETIKKPPDIAWASLVHKLIFGELVYPF